MSEMFDRLDLDRRHYDGTPEFIPFPRMIRLRLLDGIFRGYIVGCREGTAIIEVHAEEVDLGGIKALQRLPDGHQYKTVELPLEAIRTGAM